MERTRCNSPIRLAVSPHIVASRPVLDLPPLAVVAVALFAPNQVVRTGNSGTITSASAYAAGGFSLQPLTNIQTTGGTIIGTGIASVPRGQALIVRDTTSIGLQACVAGDPPECMDMGGTYVGKLMPVAHGCSPSLALRQTFGAIALLWLPLVGIGAMATMEMTAPPVADEADASNEA